MSGKTLHVKNIEKYHPGYKDRHLIWCKTYFSLIDGDSEFEMLDEIDKWRFMAFTMLELKTKKPVSLNIDYLTRKGFNFKKKPLKDTILSLSPFVEICNNPVTENHNSVTQNRIEYNIIDKNRIEKNKYKDYVFLSKEEHEKLISRFGEKGTEDRIENLNLYAHQKFKKFKEYTSHYHTILAWEKNNGQSKTSKREVIGKTEAVEGKYSNVGEEFTFDEPG